MMIAIEFIHMLATARIMWRSEAPVKDGVLITPGTDSKSLQSFIGEMLMDLVASNISKAVFMVVLIWAALALG